MPHGLILAHLKNTRYLHGGAVYRESIRDLLVASEPGLEVEEIFVHDQQHPYRRLARQVFDLLTAPFSRYPAKVKHFCTRDFKRRVAALCAARDYRLFVINGADMLWTLDLLPAGAEALYIAHNIEHRLYRQQVEKYQNIPGLRALLAADAAKFEAFELAALRRLSRIVCISRPDADILQGYCQPGVRVATIMPSFAYPPSVRRRRAGGGALKLGFLGNLEWWPNRRGLDWFLNEVWPHLAANRELHLYGQGSRARQDGRRIFGHGFVADLASVWAEIELMIQPITCGGGINIKVAESLHNRMPILATPLALRGLDLARDPAIVVLEGAKDWIDYLNSPGPEAQATLAPREENARLFNRDANRAALTALLSPAPHDR